MAPADFHSNGTAVDRTSTAESAHLQQLSDDIDYDLEATGISDGFRPAETGHSAQDPRLSNPRPWDQLPPRASTPPLRPSSMVKPRRDSLTLRHDGTVGPRAASTEGADTYDRRLSRSSTMSNERACVGLGSADQRTSSSPNAYHLYAQHSGLGGAANTGIVASTSVAEVSPANPTMPIHPYGMYPQNTAPESDSSSQISSIPVGFPGMHTYQARTCPHRATTDIVGPDGHAEQLPPYTQYPVEGSSSVARPAASLPPPPLPHLPGAGGMGLATRNPEFESRESLGAPPSRQSSISGQSSSQSNTTTLRLSEKPVLKKWQQVARKRLCAIVPIWAIVLAATVLVLLLIMVTSIMAVTQRETEEAEPSPSPNENATSTPSLTTTYDGLPFTTLPVGLLPVPTGTFGLPIMAPATAQSGCLGDAAQSVAWSCTIPPSPLQMKLQDIAETDALRNKEVCLDYGNNTVECTLYGAQPPIVDRPVTLSLVTDTQSPQRGPAWFFQISYDKIVILESQALSVPSAGLKSKRNLAPNSISSRQYLRKGAAPPGSTPWLCYWNGTILEYFLYTNVSSAAGLASSSASSFAPSTLTPSGVGPSQPTSTPSISDPSTGGQFRKSPFDWMKGGESMPVYPKLIKVVERRMPGSQKIAPYCVRHIINEDHSASPLSVNGELVKIYLNETESTGLESLSDKRDLQERKPSSCCGCVWLST